MNAETGQLDWSDLERAIGPRTRLVAIGAASNALGTINDVAAAGRSCTRVGGAAVRRRRPLRAARARRRQGARLRSAGVLGLQVLRPARRRAVRPPRSARRARRPEARSGARHDARNGSKPARRITRASSARGAAIDFLASLDRRAPARRACARSNRSFGGAPRARSGAHHAHSTTGLSAIPGVTVYGPRPTSRARRPFRSP